MHSRTRWSARTSSGDERDKLDFAIVSDDQRRVIRYQRAPHRNHIDSNVERRAMFAESRRHQQLIDDRLYAPHVALELSLR